MFPVFYYTPEPEPEPAPEREEKAPAPAPACCPECWRTTPIDPDEAMRQVRVSCGGSGHVRNA